MNFKLFIGIIGLLFYGVNVDIFAKEKPLRIPLMKGTSITIDPHKMDDAYSMALNLQIYRGLFRYSPQGEIKLDLATSWIVEDEGRTIKIKIRKAQFSNGKPITTLDVVNSFARHFLLPSTMASDIDYIKGARKFKTSKQLDDFGVKALNESEVEFRLEHPSSLFFHQLAAVDCAILPAATSPDKALNFSSKDFGFSGTYKIIHHKNGTYLLEKWRNDEMDSKSPPKFIEFFTTTTDADKIVEKDDPDMLDHIIISKDLVTKLLSKGWFRSLSNVTRENFVVLNPNKYSAPTRESLIALIDQRKIVQILNRNHIEPAFSLIPLGVDGILTENQYERIKPPFKPNVPERKIKLQHYKDNLMMAQVADHLKLVWENAGFTVNIERMEIDRYFDFLFNAKGDVLLASKGLDYFDGFSVLGYFRSNYPSNFFHVKDSAVDANLDIALTILDDKKRMTVYQRIQEQVLKHRTVVPLYFGTDSSGLWSDRVKDVPPHPMGFHMLPLQSLTM